MKLLSILLLLLLSLGARAENTAQWRDFRPATGGATGFSDHLFTRTEQELLREYLRSGGIDRGYDDHRADHKRDRHKRPKKQKSLPPGLRKKVARGGQLPPGWQRKIARGEVLDAELYAVSRALPAGVLDRIGHPEGTSVRRVEDRVVRIMDATGVILDILLNE